MADCATHPMRFETQSTLALEAAFDGGASPPMMGLCGWPRRTSSWVFARPSQSLFQSGETEEGAILWPRPLGKGSCMKNQNNRRAAEKRASSGIDLGISLLVAIALNL